MGISIFIDIHVYTISNVIGLNKENEISLPNKESIGGHRCERTTLAAKCEMFMNVIKNIIGIGKKNMTIKHGILKRS